MQSNDLENILLSSVEAALAAVFGPTTMRAVDFYVDKRIALSNPEEYSRSMRKLFGAPADLLLQRIIEGVSRGAGIEGRGISSLEECVARARAKLDSGSS
jgi:hypothetical protein